MRLAVVVLLVLVPLVGLGYWVVERAGGPRRFEIPLAAGRALPQGGFYVGNFYAIDHLNPFTSNKQVALSFVLRYTHDCLLQLDPDTRKLQPALAEVVESSPDELTHTFELRPGVTFENGDPIRVEDVQFTHDVVRDPAVKPGAIHDAVGRIASFTPLAGRRFKIVLRERHFNGLAEVAIGYRVVQRKWFLDQVAIAAQRLGRPVPAGPGAPGFGELLNELRLPGPATGPYRLARDGQGQPVWIENRELWLVQNLGSWQRAAFPRRWNLAGFGLRFLDPQLALTQLKQQQIDWHMPANPAQLLAAHPELRQHYAIHRYDSATTGHYAITWNCQRVPAPLRLVLAGLFDREFIRDDILGGSATIVDSWFRADDPEYPPHPRAVRFDPKGAREALRKLGYGAGGKPLLIRILAVADERNRRILQVAADAFRAAGITLQPDFMDGKAAQAEIDKPGERGFDGSLSYWRHSALPIDPYAIYHSKGASNEGRYGNAEVDALLEQARRTVDVAERARLYHAFHDIVRDEQPVTVLVHPLSTLLLHRRFQGVRIGWAGAVPANWWVAPGDRLHFAERGR